MRSRVILLLAALVISVPMADAVAGATATQPRLRLMDADPITFRGTGFQANERVRVVVYAGTREAKRTRAGIRGGFTVRFAGLDPNACAGFSATAIGNEGSRATLKRAPGQCPAP